MKWKSYLHFFSDVFFSNARFVNVLSVMQGEDEYGMEDDRSRSRSRSRLRSTPRSRSTLPASCRHGRKAGDGYGGYNEASDGACCPKKRRRKKKSCGKKKRKKPCRKCIKFSKRRCTKFCEP